MANPGQRSLAHIDEKLADWTAKRSAERAAGNDPAVRVCDQNIDLLLDRRSVEMLELHRALPSPVPGTGMRSPA